MVERIDVTVVAIYSVIAVTPSAIGRQISCYEHSINSDDVTACAITYAPLTRWSTSRV